MFLLGIVFTVLFPGDKQGDTSKADNMINTQECPKSPVPNESKGVRSLSSKESVVLYLSDLEIP